MKRWLAIVLCFTFITIISGCGDASDIPTSSPTVAPAATPTPQPVTDRALQVAQSVYGDTYLQPQGSSGPRVRYNVVVILLAHTIDGSLQNDQYISYTIFKAIWQTPDLPKRLSGVLLLITSTDDVSPTQIYAKAYLTGKTAAGISWDNLTQDEAWPLYDEHVVYSDSTLP
jgi:hypothetical protein